MQKQLIDFPSIFHIKIMGLANVEFEGMVIQILNQHVSDLGEGALTFKFSASRKYLSITAAVNAKSQAQLDNLYIALSQNPHVLMVL